VIQIVSQPAGIGPALLHQALFHEDEVHDEKKREAGSMRQQHDQCGRNSLCRHPAREIGRAPCAGGSQAPS
jgi:hypothetical protein